MEIYFGSLALAYKNALDATINLQHFQSEKIDKSMGTCAWNIA